jgi:hypothetical protein
MQSPDAAVLLNAGLLPVVPYEVKTIGLAFVPLLDMLSVPTQSCADVQALPFLSFTVSPGSKLVELIFARVFHAVAYVFPSFEFLPFMASA